ncbi:hypothetical protein [Pacificibacter marinus]|uniref:hypothetical protein n=1 Tax=Pacificibacter marinus TaxID=658057 RepID=UPI003CC7AD43
MGQGFGVVGPVDFRAYFLTVGALLAFVRFRFIVCGGVCWFCNSVLFFLLGVPSVRSVAFVLFFDRFFCEHRGELRAVGVDFVCAWLG